MSEALRPEEARALDKTRADLLAEVLRRCMGLDADDNARHDFGDLNGGALQRPTEVAAELLRALSDEGLTIAVATLDTARSASELDAAALRAERIVGYREGRLEAWSELLSWAEDNLDVAKAALTPDARAALRASGSPEDRQP